MAISKEKKRVPVTLDNSTYEYLERIVKIVNEQLESDNTRIYRKRYKISVSKLFYLAIGNLIMQIDRKFDVSLPAEINYKKITDFLVPDVKKKR